MRILYLAEIRFPLERANGVQTMETCHALARRGIDVTLLVRPDTSRPPRDPFVFYGLDPHVPLHIDVSSGPAGTKMRRAFYIGSAIRRLASRPRHDLVLTRDLGIAAALLRLPRSWRPPVVYESHGFAPIVSAELPTLLTGAEFPSDAKIRRLEDREAVVWRTADAYVTITKGLADLLTDRFGSRDVTIVPDGVRARADSSPHRMMGLPVVAYSGHLYPWKGVDVFVEALARVPHARGLIVGGHPDESDIHRVRNLSDRLMLSERVTFTGLVPPSRVADHLARADILVLPNTHTAISRDFSSPLKLFEYMAARRPIVASDLPSFREILTDDDAIFVEPGNATAIADAIARLIADPALAQRIADHAYARVNDYTWDRRAERLEGVFAAAMLAKNKRSAGL